MDGVGIKTEGAEYERETLIMLFWSYFSREQ